MRPKFLEPSTPDPPAGKSLTPPSPEAPLLRPWAKGPLELLKHADGHFRTAGDTDRRIALIGFDQAVEASIEVYVRLHPRLRDGLEIPKAEVDQALRSFHSKVEFIEKWVPRLPLPGDISFESIVWYHTLRNELYHSGNGMVPEMHVLEGARQAAIRLFTAIFGYDALQDLEPAARAAAEAPEIPLPPTDNPRLTFLQVFRDFEDLLQSLSQEVGIKSARSLSRDELWSTLSDKYPQFKDYLAQYRHLAKVRNQIVHSGPSQGSEAEIQNAVQQAEGLISLLVNSAAGPAA